MKETKLPARPNVPVCVRGVDYPSMSAAARAHGVNVNAVVYLLEQGRIDRLGTGKNKPKKITVFGVEYPSIQKASRESGVSYSCLQRNPEKYHERPTNT